MCMMIRKVVAKDCHLKIGMLMPVVQEVLFLWLRKKMPQHLSKQMLHVQPITLVYSFLERKSHISDILGQKDRAMWFWMCDR